MRGGREGITRPWGNDGIESDGQREGVAGVNVGWGGGIMHPPGDGGFEGDGNGKGAQKPSP